jgi:transposase
MSSELIVQNLDHLGIVAGLVDELGIVATVDQHLGEDPRERVSAGVVVKAMILNGLGMVSAPLYLFGQFFAGKATEHLLGAGVTADLLNDDRLGRVLDALYVGGLSDLFVKICLGAVQQYGIGQTSAHFDASSFAVTGDYLPPGVSGSEGRSPIAITYGYSRDHRPDLKQFVLNLVCWGDGDMPAFIELADGNQADKQRFAGLMQDFQAAWKFDGLYVADAALYSADNLKQLTGLRWLTRVPLTLKAASDLVNQLSDAAFQPTALSGYRIATMCSDYGGVQQHWFVVESQARQQTDRQQLDKTITKASQQAQAQLRQLSGQDFACEADALAALQQLAATLPWHQLSDLSLQSIPHYERPGKPKQGTAPNRMTYRPQAVLTLNITLVEMHQRRAGRFILASNDLDLEQLSPTLALTEYKAQQGDERGFRFLKDPLFFTASVFLKSPERIMALGLIMGLCLLVYNLGQRQLRQALQQQQKNLPNQLGQPTQRPTLRWVFQCFSAVHYVVLNGVKQITNLTEERQQILQLLGSTCKQYYLLG